MVGAESVFLFFLLAWLVGCLERVFLVLPWPCSASFLSSRAFARSLLPLSLSLPQPIYPSTSPKWLSSISNGLIFGVLFSFLVGVPFLLFLFWWWWWWWWWCLEQVPSSSHQCSALLLLLLLPDGSTVSPHMHDSSTPK